MKKKNLALMLSFLCSAFGWMSAQMAMPEMPPRSESGQQLAHVPASTWSQPGSSAESARSVESRPETFTLRLSPQSSQDYARIDLFFPRRASFSVAITNREGEVIRVISDPYQAQEGYWSQSFGLKTEYGQPLPAGLYFLRVQTGEEFHRLPIVRI